MHFLPGNGMYSMMVSMPMRSLHTAIRCGGIGVSITVGDGDGVHPGIITVGTVQDTCMEVIGEDGLIITTIITITIILIMLGVVSVVIGAVAMVGMVLVPAIRVSMLADILIIMVIIMVHPVLLAVE